MGVSVCGCVRVRACVRVPTVCTSVCVRERVHSSVRVRAHRASGLVVVAVHGGAGVGTVLPSVGELSGHQHPELGVLAAAAPLPALAGGALVARVAAADGGRALGAGTGHREGHARRGDGVDERRLPRGWREGRKGERGVQNHRLMLMLMLLLR